jgi:hypothetical protein
MNDELERTRKESVVAQWRYYLGISLEGLRKITKRVSQYRRCPDRKSNLVPPEYKYGAFLLDQPAQIQICRLRFFSHLFTVVVTARSAFRFAHKVQNEQIREL